jgi:hypothetical protein
MQSPFIAPPMPGRDSNDRFFDQVVSHYDAPAYVRRGRLVQQTLHDLVNRCRKQRDEWLEMAKLRLGQLAALAGDLDRLRPLLAGTQQIDELHELLEDLQPKLRMPVEPTTSPRQLRRALLDLCESLERFNRKWLAYLDEVDLSLVNAVREGYNKYYLLEKECALRSPVLARIGFHQLEPLTLADLQKLLPPLRVPRVSPE